MGIVINQSIKNTIITYIGFAIGAVNALYMYPEFLGKTFYGLTAFLLSTANIIMPLMAFGVHNTLVKFYSTYDSDAQKSQFLSFVLLLPLLTIIPLTLILLSFYKQIAQLLSIENPIIYDYVWLVPVIGLCMGYFEIFYAWVKVNMKSVLGNFIKEVFLRVLISIFLFAVYFKYITVQQFVYITVAIYLATTLMMLYFAIRVKRISLTFTFPENRRQIITYSIFIILSGSVAVLLLDIDKFMLGQYISIENIAFYSVAIFIATVISVPSRAMHQITYPITAKLMSENKYEELNVLYKKTSITLQVVGGYVLLGILVNIKSIYSVLPIEYSGGIAVVFLIGFSKYLDLILGNNNAIIFNSRYYKVVLMLGLLLAFFAVTLNMILIPIYGINGAAIATLTAITLYSLAKLLFVVFQMKLFPFTLKTLKSFGILVLSFAVFYFWDFELHPIFNIIFKSMILTVFFGFLNYYLKISPEINQVIDQIFKYILPRKTK